MGREVRSLSRANSNTFVAGDGRLVARVYPFAVNYQTSSGSYVPVDPQLVRSASGLAQRANNLGLLLPTSAGGVARVRTGRGSLSIRLLGVSGAGVVSGSRETFSSAGLSFDSTNFGYSWQLKRAVSSVRLLVKLSSGLGARLDRRGVEFVNGRGQVAWVLGAPSVRLASSGRSLATRMSVRRTGVGDVVTMRLARPLATFRPATGSASAVRAHAVSSAAGATPAAAVSGAAAGMSPDAVTTWGSTVYPGTAVYLQQSPATTGDCYVDSANPTTSYCVTSTNYVGPSDHTLLNFDIAHDVPSHVQVLSAELVMELTSESNTTAESVGVWQSAKPWTNSATWNTYDGTNAWTTKGGDTTGGLLDSVSVGAGGDVGGSFDWSVGTAVQGWVDGNPSPADGFELALTNAPGSSNKLGFGTETGSSYPFLEVYYEPRMGDYIGSKYVSQSLTDRSAVGVNAASGELQYSADDLHLAGINGFDLDLSRYYNNLSTDQGSIGLGWTMTGPDTYLMVPSTDASYVSYFDGSGSAETFHVDPTTFKWISPQGVDAVMSSNIAGNAWSSSTFTLYFRHTGVTETFTAPASTEPKYARLSTVTNRNGQKLTYTYYSTNSNQLHTITDSHGKTVTFTWGANGYIHTITDSTTPARTYTYDQNASGYLIDSYDPANNETQYRYDASANLNYIQTAQGSYTKIVYDAGNTNRVTSIAREGTTSDLTTTFGYATATGACTNAPSGSLQMTVTDPLSHASTYCTDDMGRIINVIDANGNSRGTSYTTTGTSVPGFPAGSTSAQGIPTTFNYSTDGNDNLVSVQDGSGSTSTMTKFGYNQSDTTNNKYLPISSTDAQGNITNYGYDSNGNEQTASGTVSGTTSATATMTYEPSNSSAPGAVMTSEDANNNITNYYYDSNGNLKQIVPPGSNLLNPINLTYDSANRVATISSVNQAKTSGHEVDYSYDVFDRVTQAVYKNAAGSTIATIGYVYDNDGNLLKITDSRNSTPTTYTYDHLNRLTGASLPDGTSDTYTYDNANNLSTLQDAGGTATYKYDPGNRLTSVYDPGASNPTNLGYNKDNLLTSISYPSGASVAWTYNAIDQLTKIVDTYKTSAGATTTLSYSNSYIPSGGSNQTSLVQSTTDGSGNVTNYSYDGLNRLTDATAKNSAGTTTLSDDNYTIDKAGNITQLKVTGSAVPNATTAYTYNAANEIATGAGHTYGYDGDGNETSNGNGTTMAYNALGQMTSATVAGTTTNYTYLAAGQNQLLTDGGNAIHNDLLGLASRGSAYFTRTTDGRELSERVSGATYNYLYGPQDNVIGLTDSSDHLANQYAYDPYGNKTTNTGTTPNPFGFQNGYQDASGLYHFGARYENPLDARWTQEDPMNQISDLAQSDRYGFAGDDPISESDPSGERAPHPSPKPPTGDGGSFDCGLAIVTDVATAATLPESLGASAGLAGLAGEATDRACDQ